VRYEQCAVPTGGPGNRFPLQPKAFVRSQTGIKEDRHNQEFEETITNTCLTASVQRLRMHIFHPAVIVPTVHRHADNHWVLHREGLL
jgi:hypothetical protein